jgi:hypothetical protein
MNINDCVVMVCCATFMLSVICIRKENVNVWYVNKKNGQKQGAYNTSQNDLRLG